MAAVAVLVRRAFATALPHQVDALSMAARKVSVAPFPLAVASPVHAFANKRDGPVPRIAVAVASAARSSLLAAECNLLDADPVDAGIRITF